MINSKLAIDSILCLFFNLVNDVSTIVTFVAAPVVDLRLDSNISLCDGSDTVITYLDFDVSKNYVWSNGNRNTNEIY